MHKRDQESIIFDTLKEGHTITAACKRAGVSRMFFYRLYKDNQKFQLKVDEAQMLGKISNDDLVDTMYMKKVREGSTPIILHAINKRDAQAKERSKSGNGQPTLAQEDIRQIIESMPEPKKSEHYTRLRELLDDAPAYFTIEHPSTSTVSIVSPETVPSRVTL